MFIPVNISFFQTPGHIMISTVKWEQPVMWRLLMKAEPAPVLTCSGDSAEKWQRSRAVKTHLDLINTDGFFPSVINYSKATKGNHRITDVKSCLWKDVKRGCSCSLLTKPGQNSKRRDACVNIWTLQKAIITPYMTVVCHVWGYFIYRISTCEFVSLLQPCLTSAEEFFNQCVLQASLAFCF